MNATAGDLTLKGATANAFSVTLAAQHDLVLQSLDLTATSTSKSSSFSAFAGLNYSFGLNAAGTGMAETGIGVTANVSDSKSASDIVTVTHAQTTVTGTGFVSLSSGRDTNLYGAEVNGGGITAQVARNLNITSDQDTEKETASQTSWSLGASFGYSFAPVPSSSISLSASYSKGDAYGSYASVTTTSGLFAGSSGYAVTVGGTTTLTGAALASTADASQNSLVTAALVTKDLTNSMSWKASSWGFSISESLSMPGGPSADSPFNQSNGPLSLLGPDTSKPADPNGAAQAGPGGSQPASNGGLGLGNILPGSSSPSLGGIQPRLAQKQSGGSTGVASTTIAPGAITITNAALQKSLTGKTPDQVIAALNRSAKAVNKQVDKLPSTLLKDLKNQSSVASALNAASSSTARLVATTSDMILDSAISTINKLKAQVKNGQRLSDLDKVQLALAQQELEQFAEGGVGRALLHGATQGVLGYIAGGNSMNAALEAGGGAALSSLLAPIVTPLAEKLLAEAGLGLDRQTTETLGQFVGELVIAGIGEATGGSMSAVTAASVDINNYLNSDQVKEANAAHARKTGGCLLQGLQCFFNGDYDNADQAVQSFKRKSIENTRDLVATCSSQGFNSADCKSKFRDLQVFSNSQDPWLVRLMSGQETFSVQEGWANFDAILLKHYTRARNSNGRITPEEAFGDAVLEAYKSNARISGGIKIAFGMIGGAASAMVCFSGVGTAACIVGAVSGGILATKDITEGFIQFSTYEEKNIFKIGLQRAGVLDEKAEKYAKWIEDGLIVVSVVDGVYVWARSSKTVARIFLSASEEAELTSDLSKASRARLVKAGGGGTATEAAEVTVGGKTLRVPKCSFAPETLVLMADGTLAPIASIRTGDFVMARNETTGTEAQRAITATGKHEHRDRVIVTLSLGNRDDRIVTTLEHPFWVEGRGFIPAEALRVGDRVGHWQAQSPILATSSRFNDASGALFVKAITIEDRGIAPWTAYNLTVDADHTYFVGTSNAWVHNSADIICALEDLASKTGVTPSKSGNIAATKFADKGFTIGNLANAQAIEAENIAKFGDQLGTATEGLVDFYCRRSRPKNS